MKLPPLHFKSITIVFIFLTGILKAQEPDQTIRGTIVDKQTQSPLPGVTIQLVNSNPLLATSSDENGKFRIEHVPLGRWQIKFSVLSYKERIQSFILTSGKEMVFVIELEENAVQADEVVIIAEQDKTKSNNKMATVSSRLFSTEEASRYAGSRNDPARMAANFAGVSGANDSRNDIIIRGNSPLGILWRVNGLDIPNPNHFGSLGSTGGPISILNNNTLDNSDFMTGAFPADYGNATAGVFDLKMRTGNNEKYEYLAQMGFNGFELGAEGPFSKTKKNSSFLINYRYSTLSVFKYLKIDFGTGAAIPQYQDLTFKIEIPTQKTGKFTFWGIGGLSFIDLKAKDQSKENNLYGYSGRNISYQSNVGASGISHVYLINSSSYIKTNVGISGQYNRIIADRVDTFVTPNVFIPEYRNNSYTIRYSANTTIHKKFNARNFINAGCYTDVYSTLFTDSTNLFQGKGLQPLRNYTGNTAFIRLFGQWQHKFNQKLSLNTGLSIQQFLLNNKKTIEPRAGLKYEINNKQSISFGAGLHSQLQPLYIYFSASSTANGLIETNRNLDYGKAAHLVMAYDIALFKNTRIKVETYYQQLYAIPIRQKPDYFSAINLGADFESPNMDSLISSGKGTNYGMEFTLEKFYSKGFYYLFTASVFESKYKGGDGILRNTAFNGNYVVNALAGKEFKIKTKHTIALDAKMVIAGGKRYIPVNLAASVAANQQVNFTQQAYFPQYDPYFRIDVKPSYRCLMISIQKPSGRIISLNSFLYLNTD